MIFKETNLEDVYIIELEKLVDDRGFFARSYCKNEFLEHGLNPGTVQSNVSYNKKKGTLRGMHYQNEPHEEAKLVRCTKGAIYDVIIDVRKKSDTYKKWMGVELNEQNRRMLFVPKGFAHGFITLKDDTEVFYQVSEFYTPGAEQGIKYDDATFNIEWPVEVEVISEKDKKWPVFEG